MHEWTERRLHRLFDKYNKRFFKCQLIGWRAGFTAEQPGEFGYCNPEIKQISIRIESHTSDRQVRATLVHEMAHATSSLDHDDLWRMEMERLKKAGAPTEALDFLVPYKARSIVTSFMDYAKDGASWREALNDLDDGIPQHILRECERFFKMARRTKSR
jgi:hypothetical protein